MNPKPTIKVAVAASFIALGTAAMASFELMLVADNTNKVIQRYDTYSGISLGSFGGGGFLTNALGVGVDQANNTAYVLEGGFVSKFNYNTGEPLGFAFFSSGTASMSRLRDGTLLCLGPTNLAYRYSLTGTLLAAYNVGSGRNLKAGTLGPDGRIYLTSTDGAAAQRIHWFAAGGGAQQGEIGWQNSAITSDATYITGAYGGNLYERWVPLASGGPFADGASVTAPSATNFKGAAMGHPGMAYIGTLTGGAWKIGRYETRPSVFRGYFGSFGTVDGIDVVAAPEPATMVSLGLAAALLLKRRRHAS